MKSTSRHLWFPLTVVALGIAFVDSASAALTLLREYSATNYTASTIPDTSGQGGSTLTASAGVGGAGYAAPVYVASGAGPKSLAYLDFRDFGVLTGGANDNLYQPNPGGGVPGYTIEGYLYIGPALAAKSNTGIGVSSIGSYQNEFLFLSGSGTLMVGQTQTAGSGSGAGNMRTTEDEYHTGAPGIGPVGQWFHLVKVHDVAADTVTWYVDGVVALTQSTWSQSPQSSFLDHYELRAFNVAGNVGDNAREVGGNGSALSGLGYSFTRFYQGAATPTEVLTMLASVAGNPPVVSAPASFTVTEDVAGNLLYTGTPFADTDSSSLTVTLSISDGTITGNAGTGITVGGTATARTFTGTIADLNAYFTTAGKIAYQTAANNTTARSLTTQASDGALTGSGSSTVNITPVNDAPTLTAFAGAVATTPEDTEAAITFANLTAQGDDADVDGTVDAFVVQAVSTGTLKIGTSAGAATAFAFGSNDTIDGTKSAYWTPAASATGNGLHAFTVKAKDDSGSVSATAVQATVNVTSSIALIREYDAANYSGGTIPDSSGQGGGTLTASAGRAVDGTFAAPVHVASGAGPQNRAYLDFRQFGVLTGGDGDSILTDPSLGANGYTMEGYFYLSSTLKAVLATSGLGINATSSEQNEFLRLPGGGGVADMQAGCSQTATAGSLRRVISPANPSISLPADHWVHIVKVHDPVADEVRWYTNGVLAMTETAWNPASQTGYLDKYDLRTFGVGNVGENFREVGGSVASGQGPLSGLGYGLTRFYRGAASPAKVQYLYTQVAVDPNVAPVLAAIEGSALGYTENGAAAAITATLTASDVDSPNLSSATVQITANFQSGEDVLSFVNQNGITGSFNTGDGTLTLSGSATVANYQTALRAVMYANSSDNPSTATRTVTFKVNDGSADSNTQTRNISVTAVNDAPTLTAFAAAVATTAEDTEATITLAALKAQGNEADADGTVDAFVVQAVSTGTLKIGTSAGTATAYATGSNDTIDATKQAYWTPAANANGNGLNAFTVKAKDNGGALSATAVQAAVNVTVVTDSLIPLATANATQGQTAVGVVKAIDPDGGNTFHYTIAGGADAALFQITDSAGTGVLAFISNAPNAGTGGSDGNGIYHVIVQIADGGSRTALQAIDVTVVSSTVLQPQTVILFH